MEIGGLLTSAHKRKNVKMTKNLKKKKKKNLLEANLNLPAQNLVCWLNHPPMISCLSDVMFYWLRYDVTVGSLQ